MTLQPARQRLVGLRTVVLDPFNWFFRIPSKIVTITFFRMICKLNYLLNYVGKLYFDAIYIGSFLKIGISIKTK